MKRRLTAVPSSFIPPPSSFLTGGESKNMKLGGVRESGNVEDRRGMGLGRGGMAVGGGCGTLIVIILAVIFGVDPSQFLSGGGGPAEGPPPAQQPGGAPGQQQQQ